ncbi:hypothetical protein MUK42_04650 [Musa troglodytarum]|uniref:Uncharacterized protein n=1 Tax=Musa troglodytarum TaxID=320322 RepID=A0A9E7G967_9LILI|nr:hypothetical protein MUK42_04650 [Musa troglodytarum]
MGSIKWAKAYCKALSGPLSWNAHYGATSPPQLLRRNDRSIDEADHDRGGGDGGVERDSHAMHFRDQEETVREHARVFVASSWSTPSSTKLGIRGNWTDSGGQQ